jgi:hypothetical protein
MSDLSKLIDILNNRDSEKGVEPGQSSNKDDLRENNIVSSGLSSDEVSRLVDISTIIGHTIEIGKFTPDSKHRHIAKIYADEAAQAFQVGKYKPYTLDILEQQPENTQNQTRETQGVDVVNQVGEKSKSLVSSVVGLIDNISGLTAGIIPAILGAVAIIGGAAILTMLVYKLPEIINALSGIIPPLTVFIETVYPYVKDFITTMLPKLQEFIVGILPGLGGLIKDMGPLVTGIFDLIYTNVTKVVTDIVDVVGGVISDLFDGVVKITTIVSDGIKNLFVTVSDFIGSLIGAFNGVVSFYDRNLQPTLDKLIDILSIVTGGVILLADKLSTTLLGSFQAVKDIIKEVSNGFNNVSLFFDKIINVSTSKIKETAAAITDLSLAIIALAGAGIGTSVSGAVTSFVGIFTGGGPIEKIIELSSRYKDILQVSFSITALSGALALFGAVDLSNAMKVDQLFYNIVKIDPQRLNETGHAFGVIQEKIGFLAGYSANIGLVSEGVQTLLHSTAGLKLLDESLKGVFQSVSNLDTSKIKTIAIRADIVQIHTTNDILLTQVDIQKKILQETINNGKKLEAIGGLTPASPTVINTNQSTEKITTVSTQTPRQLFNNSPYSFGNK